MQEIQQALNLKRKWSVRLAGVMAQALLLLILPSLAQAAQDAVVAVDSAPVRERPSTDAKVIESVLRGEKLRVSNKAKDGWFKARTSSGQIGWVLQNDITLLHFQSDFDTSNLQLESGETHPRREFETEPFVFLSAGGAISSMFGQDFSQDLGLDGGHIYLAVGSWADLSFAVTERVRIGLRYMSLSNTTNVQYKCVLCSSVDNFQVTLASNPVMLGVEGKLAGDDGIGSFELDGSFYFGAEFPSSTTVVVTTQNQPNSFVIQQRAIAGLVNFTVTYSFFRWLRALGGLGFYYSNNGKTQVPNKFNGSQAFSDQNGDLGDVDVQHVGPLISMGLQLAF